MRGNFIKVNNTIKNVLRSFINLNGVNKYCKIYKKINGTIKEITKQPYVIDRDDGIPDFGKYIKINKVMNFKIGTKINAKFELNADTLSQGVVSPLLRYDTFESIENNKYTRIAFGYKNAGSSDYALMVDIGSTSTLGRKIWCEFPATTNGDTLQTGDKCTIDIEILSSTSIKFRLRNERNYDYEVTLVQNVNTIGSYSPFNFYIGTSGEYGFNSLIVGYKLDPEYIQGKGFKRKLYYLEITNALNESSQNTNLKYDFYGDEGQYEVTDKISGIKGTIYGDGIVEQE